MQIYEKNMDSMGDIMGRQYAEPDRSNPNNYMLDSCVYGTLAEDEELFNVFKESISKKFCYYTTAIQDMEFIEGKGAKTYNKECIPLIKKPVPSDSIEKFKQINKELNVKWVPEVATCMRDHTRLDGTNRFVEKNSLEAKLLQEIMKKNNPDGNKPFFYSHDAIIAEATVHYGCILVSDDRKLRHTVNQFCPGRAITTLRLKEIIEEL